MFEKFYNYFISDIAEETNVSQNEMVKIRNKQTIDDQMRTMIREIIFYSMFLILLLIVTNGQQNDKAYLQNKNMVQTLTAPYLDNRVAILY